MSSMGLPPPPNASDGHPLPQQQHAAGGRRGGPVPVRPLNLGDVLDGAFKLFRADWRTLVLVAAIFLVPVQLAAAYLQRDLIGAGMFQAFTDPMAAERFMEGDAGGNAAMLIGLINGVVITPLVTGAVVAVAAGTYLGAQPSVGLALRAALGRWWALIVSWLLIIVAAMVPFIVGIGVTVGGAAAGAVPVIVAGGLLVLLAVVMSLTVLALFSGTAPAIVVEGLGALRGMGRSARLLRPRLLPVLGTLVVTVLVVMLLSVALAAVPQTVGFVVGDRFGWLLVALGSVAAGLVTTPLLAIVVTLLYFDGRVRQEGLDLRIAADELGAGVWGGAGGHPGG